MLDWFSSFQLVHFCFTRVSEIQQLMTGNNPADHLSWALQELINSSLWGNGGEFLYSYNLKLEKFEKPISLKHIPRELQEILEQRKPLMSTHHFSV